MFPTSHTDKVSKKKPKQPIEIIGIRLTLKLKIREMNVTSKGTQLLVRYQKIILEDMDPKQTFEKVRYVSEWSC